MKASRSLRIHRSLRAVHLVAIVALSCVAAPRLVFAQDDVPPPVPASVSAEDDAGWGLQLEGVTDVPLQAGGRVTFETPGGLRLSAGVGVMPGASVDLINAGVVASGGYDDATASLVRDTLDDSLVVRLHVGWRPVQDLGLILEVGYSNLSFSGTHNEKDVAEASGIAQAAALANPAHEYVLSSSLHMLDAELAYLWELGAGFTLRAGLGLAATVAADSSIEPNFTTSDPELMAEFTEQGEAFLDETYTSYVFVPTVGLALGYRFGW